MSSYDREKETLPLKFWDLTDEDLFWQKLYQTGKVDRTLYEKLPEWLQNFKVNFDTIGFDRSIEDIPRIKGSAIVIDNQMSNRTLEENLPLLKDYDGTVLVCDRALWKVIPHKVPDYVANLDSSYLCLSFFDRPDVREVMEDVTAIFAVTTHPLTIRRWHGKRRFFTPYMGGMRITESLCATSKTPYMSTGGNVATFIWLLALNLGANPIGLLGYDNCYENMGQTEYPDITHKKWTRNPYNNNRVMERPIYIDPVYIHYANMHHRYIKYAFEEHDICTANLCTSGIMHSQSIADTSLEDFIKNFPKGVGVTLKRLWEENK